MSAPAAGALRVCLTFDAEHPDRPTEPGVHERILAILEREGIRATFFLQGRWVEAYPALARTLPAQGHLVGNHSFYHARMPLLSPAGFATDVRRAERVIRDVVKLDPAPWFRLPFGSGAGARRTHAALDALGYRHVGWHADGREWRKRLREREVEEALLRGVTIQGDGAIVLMHSWAQPIPAALEALVPRLRNAGASFHTVDELPGESLP